MEFSTHLLIGRNTFSRYFLPTEMRKYLTPLTQRCTGKMLTCLFDLAQDHSDNAIGVAATIAHEMGHNFGMNHDSAGCCTTPAADGGCIMASATG